jgi:GR25 family glycosyltransferase involved in LPS biosynthesis
MKSLIEFFDRAYIINLPDRTDRRRSVEREFEAIGEKLPNEKVRFYSAVRPTEAGDFYSIGARGSFNSHRMVLELAAGDALRNVLVFEDDVAFRKVSPASVASIIEALRGTTWDVVYFGYVEPESVEPSSPLVAWSNPTVGGHFYAVNGHFLEPMIRYMNDCEKRPRNHPDGGPMSRDGVFNHIRNVNPGIRVFVAVPNLAFQRSSRTDIAPLKFYDRVTWLKPILLALRRLKTRVRILRNR